MQHFRNILVAVSLADAGTEGALELSAPTASAVDRAIWLASRTNAQVTFLTVIESSAQAEELLKERFEEAQQSVLSAAGRAMDQIVDQAAQEGVQAQKLIVSGTAWLEILKQAERGHHDLLIIGARERSLASRLFFGSTAKKVVRNCSCPVLVTKPEPEHEVLNILVASDLGPVSQRALQIAVQGGQLCDSRLVLVHALDLNIEHRMWLTGMADAEVKEYRQQKHAEAEQQLHQQLAQTDYRTLSHGVQVVVREGEPDAVILDAIEEFDIHLVVMGTAARSGIPGVLIGNTAERLMNDVTCSILAIKPEGFVCPVNLET